MDRAKQKALKAAGWRIGDASEFLAMSDEERQLLDARIELALAVRRQRQSQGVSQQELADRLGTSQPRVAKIERAASDVSFDQMLRAFTLVGGTFVVQLSQRRSKANQKDDRKANALLLKVKTQKDRRSQSPRESS